VPDVRDVDAPSFAIPQGALTIEPMHATAPASRLGTILRRGAPLLLVFLLSGCLLPPEPKTEAGQDVFNLYLVVLALAAIVFVGVEGFILYAVIRYRRKPGDDVLPEQLHGNNTIELIWTVIPTVIVMVLFVFSFITLGEVEAAINEDDAVQIEVEGFQWQWTFRYDNGAETTGTAAEPPTLVLPVGVPVQLELISLDVNHAFYVPEFLIKRDVIDFGPAREPNKLAFTVTEEGTYAGQCAEFCGVAHADMTFVVDAMPREEFDAHIEALAAGEPPPAGGDGECETTVQLAAVPSLQWDTDAIEAPDGESFCIEFTNNDSAPHDVAIEGTDFDGETVEPGGSITYVVPALEAGDYTFFCTIHPQMTGDVRIGG
jgi:cytochrome c oxidase subunit II